MRNAFIRYAAISAASVAGMAACAGPRATNGSESDPDASTVVLIGQDSGARGETLLLSRTVVHLHHDGTRVVKNSLITPEEQRAEVAARYARISTPSAARFQSQEDATNDTDCVGSSIWMYDTTDTTGNEICFYAAGTFDLDEGPSAFADLSEYTYCSAYAGGVCTTYTEWAGSVKSIWPGLSSGCITSVDAYNSMFIHQQFSGGQAFTDTYYPNYTNYLWLNQACCLAGYDTCDEYNTTCTDVQTDVSNCGSCGNACGANETCVSGTCECLTGYSSCGTFCANLQTDPDNCGSCGNNITGTEPGVCTAGENCLGAQGNCYGVDSYCCDGLTCYLNDSGMGPEFWCGAP